MNPVIPYDPANPQQTHDWGHITWQHTGKSPDVSSMTIGCVQIAVGKHNPRHRHNRCDEVLHLIRGRLAHSLGDAEYTMGPGDSIAIPAGVYHHARNIGDEPADMLVCFSSGDRDFEMEWP